MCCVPSVGVSCAVFLCLCHIFAVLRYLGLSFAFMCYFDMFLALYLLPWAAIGCPGLSWAVSGSVLSWALRCIGLSSAVAGCYLLSWAIFGCLGLAYAILGWHGLPWALLGSAWALLCSHELCVLSVFFFWCGCCLCCICVHINKSICIYIYIIYIYIWQPPPLGPTLLQTLRDSGSRDREIATFGKTF